MNRPQSHPLSVGAPAIPVAGRLAPAPMPSPANGVGASLSNLPLWANSDYARQLLARIIAERPQRTRVLTQTMSGDVASFGFAGRSANQLRAVYGVFEQDRMDWVAAAGFGTPLYDKRRNALIRYERDHGPDALVERILRSAGQ